MPCQSACMITDSVHLSPFLFVLYSSLLYFADEMKIFIQINSTDNCLYLKNYIDSFSRWCKTLGSTFNTYKCPVMKKIDLNLKLYGIIEYRIAILYSFANVLDITVSNYLANIEMVCCKSLKFICFIICLSKDFKLEISQKSLYCMHVCPLY